MRILHYSLGFPPYRTGGLTKFCMDVMREQVKEGHEVSLLWPGQMLLFDHKTRIKKKKSVDGIYSYEVINPTPISYDEGISDFDDFFRAGEKEAYQLLLDQIKPSVIHVHTLMGLHKSLLEVAKQKGIRLVFTAHDFFPICPKVTMFRNGGVCKTRKDCSECGKCNSTSLSISKIKMLQSPAYRFFKENSIIKTLRKRHRDSYLHNLNRDKESVGSAEDYRCLRNHYYSMLMIMDIVHYNSSITKRAYEEIIELPNTVVIPITHADIKDSRKIRNYCSKELRIRYLGAQSAAKGYYLLENALNVLWREKKDFVLDIHFKPTKEMLYMRFHGRYTYNDLEEIFDNTDVLVCPSQWFETFGYTVLEALSFGVPVIVSDCVGAKDIIPPGGGIIFKDEMDLIGILRELSNEDLIDMNANIVNHWKPEVIADFLNKIMLIYTLS